MRSRWMLAIVLAGAAALGAGVTPAPALGQTFTYTGSEQTFSVPAGVTDVHVVEIGASGAQAPEALPGYAALLSADVPLPPGTTTLYVEVGGVGVGGASDYDAAGGFNGGGGGVNGGGGASDVRTVSCADDCAAGGDADSLASRLAVAGGGGGGAFGVDGGSAGSSDGWAFGRTSTLGGGGGTTGAGGDELLQSQVTTVCTDDGDAGGEPGEAGSVGLGGAGFTALITSPKSGGGGGGLYGGGGGSQCYKSPGATGADAGAGGGGSSAAPNGVNVSISMSTAPAEVIVTAPVPQADEGPGLSGDTQVGDQLTESHASWTTSQPLVGFAYQWQRCGPTGASCAAIQGASQQTYGLTSADVGHTLRVQETTSNFYGASQPAISTPSSVVTAAISPPSPTPRLTGTVTARFGHSGHKVTVKKLVVHAPVGASIVLLCSGGGCPRSRTVAVKSSASVALTAAFRHRKLATKTHITVRIVRPGYIGKVYVFSLNKPRAPTQGCLAPGGTVPGKNC